MVVTDSFYPLFVGYKGRTMADGDSLRYDGGSHSHVV